MKENYDNENHEKRKYIKDMIDEDEQEDFILFLYKKKKTYTNIDDIEIQELMSLTQEFVNNKGNTKITTNKNELEKENDSIIPDEEKNKNIKSENKPITIKKFINTENIKIEIFHYETDKGSSIFNKLDVNNLSNMTFYIYMRQFNVTKIKRIYSDFEWLYNYINKGYDKANLLPELPKGNIINISFLGMNKIDPKEIQDKLEVFMNYLVNEPILKTAKVIFDFLTNDNYTEFQNSKETYDKIEFKNILINSKDENKHNIFYNNNFFIEKPILKENDYINQDYEIKIQSGNIGKEIENYLQKENYLELRNYCYECTKDEVSKAIMVKHLNLIYKEGTNNIYALIDKYEILKILMFIDQNNYAYYFNKIYNILKKINNEQNLSMDEYFTRINKFSEIVKSRILGIDLSEELAEENLRHIKNFIDTFYKGKEKDAVHPYLKEKHVEIILDYSKVIVEKYKNDINEEEIIRKLKELKELKEDENIEEKLNLFIQSLNEHEQLYYDLLVQSILEAPKSDSAMKSWAIPIIKIIKEIFGTIVSTAIVSFTGSKILTSISAGIGTSLVIRDINDMYIKENYFKKENDEFRRVYHINQRLEFDKRLNIIKRNIKNICRNIAKPIKSAYSYVVDTKILNIKENTKMGFEKTYKNIDYKEKGKIFLNNLNKIIKTEYNNKQEQKYKQILIKMKKYFRENAKSGRYKKIQNEFDIKEKEINEKTNAEKEDLQKKYAHLDIKDNSCIQKQVKSLLEFGNNIKDVFTSIIFDEKRKNNNSELMLEIINNHEYKNYLESLEEINNNDKEEQYKILESEVKNMCYITQK